MNEFNERNPLLAGLVSLFIGPLGFAYISLGYMISGIFVAIIFNSMLSLIDSYYPHLFIIFQFIVYGIYGYKNAKNLNTDYAQIMKPFIKAKTGLSEIGFVFFMTIPLYRWLIQSYSLIIGIYFIYLNIISSKYGLATLILFIGMPVSFFGLTYILSNIYTYLIISILGDKESLKDN